MIYKQFTKNNVSSEASFEIFTTPIIKARKARTAEIQIKSCKLKICTEERKFAVDSGGVGGKPHLVMFIGDRDFGVGSHIKGHLKYGGKWKQEVQSQYTHAIITNENYTSQTCVYCFSKLDHPTHVKLVKGKEVFYKSKGSFLCRNQNCVLFKNKKATKCRDDLSAMAIGISGLSTVLFHETLPAFRTNVSQYNTEFITNTSTFLNRKSGLDSNDVTIRNLNSCDGKQHKGNKKR